MSWTAKSWGAVGTWRKEVYTTVASASTTNWRSSKVKQTKPVRSYILFRSQISHLCLLEPWWVLQPVPAIRGFLLQTLQYWHGNGFGGTVHDPLIHTKKCIRYHTRLPGWPFRPNSHSSLALLPVHVIFCPLPPTVNGFDLALSVYPLLQPHAPMLSVRHKSAKLIKDSSRALMLPSLSMPLFKQSRILGCLNAFQTLWSDGGVCIVYVGDGRLLPLRFYSVFRLLLQVRSCNDKERNLLCCRQSY